MSVDREMPRYKCHKEVWALKIAKIEQSPADFVSDGGSFHITPEDEGYAPFPVSTEFVNKNAPQAGGYYVVYEDGYKSYSPAHAFESGYTLMHQGFSIAGNGASELGKLMQEQSRIKPVMPDQLD